MLLLFTTDLCVRYSITKDREHIIIFYVYDVQRMLYNIWHNGDLCRKTVKGSHHSFGKWILEKLDTETKP